MAKVKSKTIKVTEPPKIPTLSFSKRGFGLSQGLGPKPKFFVPQTTRITQHKGGPSGGGGK